MLATGRGGRDEAPIWSGEQISRCSGTRPVGACHAPPSGSEADETAALTTERPADDGSKQVATSELRSVRFHGFGRFGVVLASRAFPAAGVAGIHKETACNALAFLV